MTSYRLDKYNDTGSKWACIVPPGFTISKAQDYFCDDGTSMCLVEATRSCSADKYWAVIQYDGEADYRVLNVYDKSNVSVFDLISMLLRSKH